MDPEIEGWVVGVDEGEERDGAGGGDDREDGSVRVVCYMERDVRAGEPGSFLEGDQRLFGGDGWTHCSGEDDDVVPSVLEKLFDEEFRDVAGACDGYGWFLVGIGHCQDSCGQAGCWIPDSIRNCVQLSSM